MMVGSSGLLVDRIRVDRAELWPFAATLGSCLYAMRHVRPGVPTGSDWGQYLSAAAYLHGVAGGQYPEWRRPLYPWLVGAIGQALGFVTSAQIIAVVSTWTIIASAAFAARLVSGRTAGIVAAVSAVLLTPVAWGVNWVTVYPALGAATGLATLSAAAAIDRPRWYLALGGACGLTMALDHRGIVMLAAAIVFALRSKVRVTALPMLLLGFAALFWVDFALVPSGVAIKGLFEQTSLQTALKLAPSQIAEIPELASCRGSGGPSTLACQTALLAFNAARLERAGALPPIWVGLLMPLAVFPSKSRGFALTIVGIPVLALILSAVRLPLEDRYLVQVAPAFAVASGISASTISAAIADRAGPRAVAVVPTLVLLSWFVALRPWIPAPNPRESAIPRLTAWVDANRDARELYDCTGLNLDLVTLPAVPAGLRSLPPVSPPGRGQMPNCTSLVRSGQASPDARLVIAIPRRGAVGWLDRVAFEQAGWAQVTSWDTDQDHFQACVRRTGGTQ